MLPICSASLWRACDPHLIGNARAGNLLWPDEATVTSLEARTRQRFQTAWRLLRKASIPSDASSSIMFRAITSLA
jgi:hypothetical protein